MSHPKIEQANMDGKDRTVLTSLRYPSSPTGLTVHQNRLYWCDRYYHVLNYINLDSHQSVTTIHLSRDFNDPLALASLGGILYLLNKGPRGFRNGSIVEIDGDSGLVTSRLAWNLASPESLCTFDRNVSIATGIGLCLVFEI